MSKNKRFTPSQEFKDTLIILAMVLLKILGTLRMSIDTYVLADTAGEEWPLLNVLLLDGAMITSWMYVTYGGQSKRFKNTKFWAVGIAWSSFVFQLVIGGKSGGFVGVAARNVVAGLLAMDTWQYIATIWEGFKKAAENTGEVSLAAWRRKIREGVWQILAFVSSIIVIPFALTFSVILVALEYGTDALSELGNLQVRSTAIKHEATAKKARIDEGGKTLSAEHRQRISRGVKASHARRKKEARANGSG